MKIVLGIVGSLSGLYTIAAVAQLIGQLSSGNSDPALIAASVVPAFLGLIICVFCFQRAFRR